MYESFIGTNNGGPKENTLEHRTLESKMGFSYQTLLGEMMYTYVTCRLDISYAITTLLKFSTAPTKLNYLYLKMLLIYLFRTRHWGIWYHRICKPKDYFDDLKVAPKIEITSLLKEFENFPKIDPTVLTCFVDAAYANDPQKRRSTTGYAIMMAGGAFAYRSKTQTVTALSSTEAEFFAAVSAAKVILFLRSVLH